MKKSEPGTSHRGSDYKREASFPIILYQLLSKKVTSTFIYAARFMIRLIFIFQRKPIPCLVLYFWEYYSNGKFSICSLLFQDPRNLLSLPAAPTISFLVEGSWLKGSRLVYVGERGADVTLIHDDTRICCRGVYRWFILPTLSRSGVLILEQVGVGSELRSNVGVTCPIRGRKREASAGKEAQITLTWTSIVLQYPIGT